MKTYQTTEQIEVELDEFPVDGLGLLCVHGTAEVVITPEEPPEWQNCYPGCPESREVVGFRAIEYIDERGVWRRTLLDEPKFAAIDRAVLRDPEDRVGKAVEA